MDYLTKYNVKKEQFPLIEEALKKAEVNVDIFLFNSEKVEAILSLFKDIGVVNIFEIIVAVPEMFCDTVTSIKIRLDSYRNNEELAKLLNEDVNNLKLVDLL